MNDRDGVSREWIAAFSHELRSPLSSILGYAELVADGALGSIDPRAADAVLRMGAAADQLIALLDGVEAATEPTTDRAAADIRADEVGPVGASAMIGEIVDLMRHDAESRDVGVVVEPADIMLRTVEADAVRAVTLALSAAVKGSPGRQLRIRVADAAAPAVVIDGSSLDATRDAPSMAMDPAPMTGCALRLSLARSSARRAGGDVHIRSAGDDTSIIVTLPLL